jgi:nucleotide-binding universal stress UspA family protein
MASAQTPLATIVHPTDFAAAGASALAHALKIALVAKSQLCLLNVRREGDAAPSRSGFRHVRDILVNWGMLGPDAPPDSLERELGLRLSSVSVPAANARKGILDFLDSRPCDLVVLSTQQHKRPAQWFDVSVQQGVLRKARVASLFLREGARGFVDPRTGALSLTTILVPIDDGPASIAAVRRIEARVKLLSPWASIQLLHVGERAPELIDAQGESLRLPAVARRGPVIDTILNFAAHVKADLIAMPTAGRHGLLDAVRGSTTARVLDDARWPLVAVPMD